MSIILAKLNILVLYLLYRRAAMKYQIGQQAILLTTDYKPAAEGVIKHYNEDTQLYSVIYKYPHGKALEETSVPQERLVLVKDFIRRIS
jgi:hypothetical protein